VGSFIADRIESLILFIWDLLPDECEVEGCCRKGVRGNENVVDGVIMCDYCHAKDMERRGVTHDTVEIYRGKHV
jgi:hypothetical protein